jgi:hypothetical protein
MSPCTTIRPPRTTTCNPQHTGMLAGRNCCWGSNIGKMVCSRTSYHRRTLNCHDDDDDRTRGGDHMIFLLLDLTCFPLPMVGVMMILDGHHHHHGLLLGTTTTTSNEQRASSHFPIDTFLGGYMAARVHLMSSISVGGTKRKNRPTGCILGRLLVSLHEERRLLARPDQEAGKTVVLVLALASRLR